MKTKNKQTEKEFLENYNPDEYEKPSVTTDILLFTIDEIPSKDIKKSNEKVLKLLLVKRKEYPFKNHWAIPGGFVNIDEGLINCAYRELKEETNVIDDVYLEQLYTFGDDVKRDPRMRIISSAYMALTNKENIKKTIAGDDASEAKWFEVKIDKISNDSLKKEEIYTISLINNSIKKPIKYLIKKIYSLNKNEKTLDVKIIVSPANKDVEFKLAFDHIKIIDMALDRLKNKVEYTPIAFSLLPEKFTLNEVQMIYEILLNKKMVKQNFRTKIIPMLNKTNDITVNVGYRPAIYYTFNPYWEFELNE